jgi:Protein of unknown function (DUF3015)
MTKKRLSRRWDMTKYTYTLLLSGVLLSLSGCITDATVELTKAPFDATTALTDGTSKAIGELLDPTTDFTSSTTPGALTGDPLMKARRKTEVFAASSYENLRSDVARGSGEYLVSLATLAGIPPDRQADFQVQMSDAYSTMFREEMPLRESTARIVEAAWSSGHGRTELKPKP